MKRREFLHRSAVTVAAAGSLIGCCGCGSRARSPLTASPTAGAPPVFTISLAQWSLNRGLFAGEIDPLEFPSIARKRFGIDAVEYVNVFINGGDPEEAYLAELKRRADDAGVRSVLIMVDREGALGDADDARRTTAIENHYKWIHAATVLGWTGDLNPYKYGSLGVIEAGRYADMILVDGNPLEDISVLRDYSTNFKVIMKNGMIWKDTL